jgi:CRISPR-associated exonuclease Cas4
MNIILIFTIVTLVAGLGLLAFWFWQNSKLGVLKNKYIYADSGQKPAEILFSKTLALSGKPDYLINQDNMVIPVEVKSSRTPNEPYQNHVMQLMAYCLLVEENYGSRPIGGYIKYPDKEFKVAYTDEARNCIRELVGEMLLLKHSGKELHCNHPEHNIDLTFVNWN